MVLSRGTLVVVAGLTALLAGCGSDDGAGSGGGIVDVAASFYPLQYVVERVGGPYARVTNLTPAGAEPHDLELTPREIARLSEADLVVYLDGFSPAVDDAVSTAAPKRALDVGSVAGLDLSSRPVEGGGGERPDPHFWLDPDKLGAVADAVADRLSSLRPDAAATFTDNARSLRADLDALDGSYVSGLASCASRELVTSHTAFGYLARRYELEQVGIAGLSPEEEPTAADLAEVAVFVKAHDVRTIYYESLVSPAIARTIAAETGATTAVLDPLEGLSDASAGDFLAVMRVNLATLREGQGCR